MARKERLSELYEDEILHCPYSVNGRCTATKTFKVSCFGEKYLNCELYKAASKEEDRKSF